VSRLTQLSAPAGRIFDHFNHGACTTIPVLVTPTFAALLDSCMELRIHHVGFVFVDHPTDALGSSQPQMPHFLDVGLERYNNAKVEAIERIAHGLRSARSRRQSTWAIRLYPYHHSVDLLLEENEK
jgi:hypothetical protein